MLSTRLSTKVSTSVGTVPPGDASLHASAGSDSGAWVSCAQTLYGSAVGGVAPYTYEWTVQSGGAGAFSDDASPTSTFTPTGPSAGITLQLEVTDALGAVALSWVTLACTFDAVITNGTGFTRHFWFEVSAGTTTLIAGECSQLNDRWAGAYHLTATAGQELPYFSSGGPGDLPYLTTSVASDALANTAIALSSGRRLSFYVFAALLSTDNRSIFATKDASGGQLVLVHYSNSTTHLMRANYSVSGLRSVSVTTPAPSTGWRRWTQRYTATATEASIGGTPISPTYTTGTGEAAAALENITVGNGTGFSGGKFHAAICLEGDSAAVAAFVNAYLDALGT